MEIVTYRELKDKNDIFLLWAESFSWLCTPGWLQKWADEDRTLKNSPIGYCGIIDGKLCGIVGVMEIPTRTKAGEVETIGGIWAIATRPTCNRQGIGRRLLEASEDYFRTRGFRLAMLTTSRSIVAHRWYSSVGYSEVEVVNRYPHFYKVLGRKTRESRAAEKGKRKFSKGEIAQMQAVYRNYTEGRCGFVLRDDFHWRFCEKVGRFNRKTSIIREKGYVLASEQFGSLRVSEIVASSQKMYRELIRDTEVLAKDNGVAARFVFDPQATQAFAKAGYRVEGGSYGVLMVKPLGEMTFDDLYDDTFTIGVNDFF